MLKKHLTLQNILLFTILLMPLDIFQYTFFNLRPWNIICFIGIFFLILNKLMKREPINTPLGWVFFLFLMTYILSIFNSSNVTYSILQLLKLILIDVLLYILVVNVVHTSNFLLKAYKILFLAGLIVGAFGIIQMIAIWFFGINLMWWNFNLAGPPAWFTERTWYGNYLVFVFSAFIALYPRLKERSLWFSRFILLFLISCILLSNSRAALVTLVLLIVINELFVNFKKPIRLLVKSSAALIALAFAFFFLREYWERIFMQENVFARLFLSSNADRIPIVEVAIKSIANHPFIGNGIGTWGDAIGMGMRWPATFNIFLTILYDAGILGLLVFMLMLLTFLFYCYRELQYQKGKVKNQLLLRATFYMVVCVLLLSQFHPFYLSGYAWLGISLGVATIAIMRRDRKTKENHV
ncbi:MAG: O-antigen ligase family protein [Candidatus Saganbacteria bacterium]|nr:O-antigen ligase family protein [Candidatus Saganbacteria bacterium]